MARVERSTSSGGKRYLTDKVVAFDTAEGRELKLGGADNGNGQLEIYDDTDTLFILQNKDGIALSNGAKLIGSTGVLSTFQYPSYNYSWDLPNSLSIRSGYWFLGYNMDLYDVSDNWANFIAFDVNIPADFVITDARIVLFHSPVNWDNGGDYDVWGYCRNIKAYTITDYNTIGIVSAYQSSYGSTTGYTFSEISGAFGASGFTAGIPTDLSHPSETTTSANIASSLVTGFNKIAVKTSDAVPTFNPDLATNATAIGIKTGMVFGFLKVTGYQS